MMGIQAKGTNSAKVIQVIETKALKGSGTTEDPIRYIIQYWSLEGELLVEKDETNKPQSTQ